MYLRIFLLVSFVTIVHCTPVSSRYKNRGSSGSISPRADDNNSCGFQGNTDIYGVGIRLGYYCQTLALWFANVFTRQEALQLRALNSLFVIAMLVGLVALSVNSQTNYAAEAFVLLQILLATWSVGTADVSRFRKQKWNEALSQNAFKDLTGYALFAYIVWFWWHGLDVLKTTPCGTYGFLLTKFSLYGNARTVFKVLSLIAATYGSLQKTHRLFLAAVEWKARDVRPRVLAQVLQREIRRQTSFGPVPGQVLTRSWSTPTSDSVLSQSKTGFSLDSTDILQSKPENFGVLRHQVLSNGSVTPSELRSADTLFEQLENVWDNAKKTSRPFQYRPFGGRVLIYLPNVLIFYNAVQSTIFQFFSQSIIGNVKYSVIFAILHHISLTRGYKFDASIYVTNHILSNPDCQTMSWRSIYAMSRIRWANTTDRPHKEDFYFWASTSFALVILQVVAVELTLKWNHVQGLGGFWLVGQLVPFVLGVGTLLMVIYSWASTLMHKAQKEEEEEENTIEAHWKKAAEAYYTWKKTANQI